MWASFSKFAATPISKFLIRNTDYLEVTNSCDYSTLIQASFRKKMLLPELLVIEGKVSESFISKMHFEMLAIW